MSLTQQAYRNLTTDNILVSQKDTILDLINDAVTNTDHGMQIKSFQAALFTLRTLRDHWVSESYGYKYNELLRRIDNHCQDRLGWLHHAAKNQRRDLGRIIKICSSSYVTVDLEILSKDAAAYAADAENAICTITNP